MKILNCTLHGFKIIWHTVVYVFAKLDHCENISYAAIAGSTLHFHSCCAAWICKANRQRARGSSSIAAFLCPNLLHVYPWGLCPKSLNSQWCIAEPVQQHITHRKCANSFPFALLTPCWKYSHADLKTLLQNRLCTCLAPLLHTTDWKHPTSFMIQTGLQTCF